MLNLANQIILSWGWKRRFIAFFAGATGVLALSPFDFIPAMFVPMTAAVWLLDGTTRSDPRDGFLGRASLKSVFDAAGLGWWLGFGYFLAGLWWLGSAFLVEADKFLWALPLAVGGLPAGLALFTAAGFAVARILWSSGGGRVFALAAGLGAAEWMRGLLFTGFPWNVFGMAFGGNLLFGQIAAFIGLYGLTSLTILVAAAPATLIDPVKTNGPRWTSLGGRVRPPVLLAVLLLMVMGVVGALRLKTGSAEFETGIKLRIMQPNIPQDAKFRPENKEMILRHYLALSDRATSPQSTGVADVTHLVWPESPFPFILSRDAPSLARIGMLLGDSTILITGAARMGDTIKDTRNPGRSKNIYYNSIHVIGKGGVLIDTYDKVHLVPFGEYLPFSRSLESLGVTQMVSIPGGFDAGAFRKLLVAPGLPAFSPLICYEALFPGEVTPQAGKGERPGFMLNVTNDAWFGETIGPYQHFAQARLRAIEEGLPLIRAANTGISAIIDPYGRILEQLPLGVEGILDGRLPRKIGSTLFSSHPVSIPLSILLILAFGALVAKMRH